MAVVVAVLKQREFARLDEVAEREVVGAVAVKQLVVFAEQLFLLDDGTLLTCE